MLLKYLVSCGRALMVVALQFIPVYYRYAPVLRSRSVTDEDPSPGIALQDLSVRIMENLVSPRLLRLTDRVLRMRGSSADIPHQALPYLTSYSLPCACALCPC